MMQTMEEITRHPNRVRFILLAHIQALAENADRDARSVREAAHQQALMEQNYRSCRVYGMGRR